MKEQIKELRVEIDMYSQLVQELKPFIKFGYEEIAGTSYKLFDGNSKQIEQAYNSLILGKAWLGKMLGELGEETPYKNDGNRKTINDIEDTADTAKSSTEYITGLEFAKLEFYKEKNHIEKVDYLRQEIQLIINKIENIEGYIPPSVNTKPSCKLERYTNQCIYHLCEARFWLGFELERIKNNK